MKTMLWWALWLAISAIGLTICVVATIAWLPFMFVGWVFDQCSFATVGCDYD